MIILLLPVLLLLLLLLLIIIIIIILYSTQLLSTLLYSTLLVWISDVFRQFLRLFLLLLFHQNNRFDVDYIWPHTTGTIYHHIPQGKHRFSSDHRSLTLSGEVSTWMGDPPRNASCSMGAKGRFVLAAGMGKFRTGPKTSTLGVNPKSYSNLHVVPSGL